MSAMASQTTGVSIVYSTFGSGVDQRKHQSSASLALVRGIHGWPVNFPYRGPVTQKCFHLMTSSCHFDEISLTGCTRRHFDNFLWWHWWRFVKMIYISVLKMSPELCKYYGYWCPCPLRRQTISRYTIHHKIYACSYLVGCLHLPGMETLSSLFARCVGNHLSPVVSHHRGVVMWSFDGFCVASIKPLKSRWL